MCRAVEEEEELHSIGLYHGSALLVLGNLGQRDRHVPYHGLLLCLGVASVMVEVESVLGG